MLSFRVVSAVALILAIVLAVMTSMFSYLAAVSASSSKCAELSKLQGYLTGITDFLAFPIFSVAFVAPLVMARKGQKTRDLIASNEAAVFRFGPIHITHGMFVVCAVLFTFVFFNAVMARFSIARYFAISRYCYSLAV